MLIDGKKIAAELLAELKKDIELNDAKPSLAIILVGENPASIIYVNNKLKRAHEVGIKAELYKLDSTMDQNALVKLIERLNNDNSTHGMIVQMPLPNHINSQAIIEAIDPQKDVDGFHPINVGYLSIGIQSGFVPCTPLGCLYLLQKTLGKIDGKHVVIVGRSNIVGKPLAQLLINANCTVTLAHSRTQNLELITHQADVVVTAVGKPKMFTKKYFNANATIIDVGINKFEINDESMDGLQGSVDAEITSKNEFRKRVVGDVDFDDVYNYVANITPVPGGVGPMTIAFLLKNTFKAYNNQK